MSRPYIDGTMTSTRVQRKRSRRSRKPVESGESLDVFCMVSQLGGWQAWRELAARVDALHRPVTQEELEIGHEPAGCERQAAFVFEEPGDDEGAGE